MKIIKFSLIFLLIIFISSSLFSQNENNSKNNNLSYSVEFGSSIGKYYNTNFFSTYIMPSITYSINPRLNINTGIIYSNSFFGNNLNVGNIFENNNNTAVRNYIFSQADYKVNEKLIITGDIIYGKNIFSNNSKFSTYSYSVGAEYKINEHLQIGIQLRQSSVGSPQPTVGNLP